MTAKHTPGPWVYAIEQDEACEPYHIMTKDGLAICDMAVDYSSIPDAELIADAKHIVHCVNFHDEWVGKIEAADDLLIALEDMLAQGGGMPKSCGHEFYCVCPGEKAIAAIAKAKGE